MRRLTRICGIVLTAIGVLALAWVIVVWQWQDPFTALYTLWQQHELEGQLSQEFRDFGLPPGTGRGHPSAAAEAEAIA
ncbi:MAG: hypothetical protein QOG85_2226, partial [Gaiellaceae bacterium]|nr:hypothetical protein [Gaiellaceae bacterium]